MEEYKKQLLHRKAKCKEFLGRYINKITDLLGDNIITNFISLEESDNIRKTKFENVVLSKTYEVIDAKDYLTIMDDIKQNDGNCYVFIDHDWEYCGCFCINSLKQIKNNFIFGARIMDSIVLIERSLNFKITLDYYEEDNRYYVEMTYSGKSDGSKHNDF